MDVPLEKIVRRRRLVFETEVLVEVGDEVQPDTVVAKSILPLPRLFFISVFRVLPRGNPEGFEVEWLKTRGETVDYGAPIVRFRPREKRAKENMKTYEFKSPLQGVIEDVMEETGQVRLREKVDYGERSAVVHIAQRLDVPSKKIENYMRHKVGDFLEKNQILAKRIETGDENSPGEVRYVRAPIAGVITEIDRKRGSVKLEREFKEVEIHAGFFGRVSAVNKDYIEIAARAKRVWGVCGIGGESFGLLRVTTESNKDELTEDDIHNTDEGKILVAGSFVTLDALKKAANVGVKGVLTGGVDHIDICRLLRTDVPLTVTGKEKTPFPLIITERFGRAPMDEKLFAFLRRQQDNWVLMNGKTQMRAGVIRPEILIMPKKKTDYTVIRRDSKL